MPTWPIRSSTQPCANDSVCRMYHLCESDYDVHSEPELVAAAPARQPSPAPLRPATRPPPARPANNGKRKAEPDDFDDLLQDDMDLDDAALLDQVERQASAPLPTASTSSGSSNLPILTEARNKAKREDAMARLKASRAAKAQQAIELSSD